MLNETLDAIADAVNPVLATLTLVFPLINQEAVRKHGSAWSFWGRTLVSLMVVYGILFADSRFGLWLRFGLDYSTHTAFAVAIITSLAMVSFRWLFFLIPLLIAYAGLMMYLGYHSLTDILTAALVIAPITWWIQRIGRGGGPTAANAPQNWKRSSP